MNDLVSFSIPLPCRPRARFAGITLGLLLAIAPLSPSTAFTVVENSSGIDLLPERPIDFAPPATVTLGENRVDNFTGCFTFGCADTFDSMRFEVPVGLEITSTEFEITGANIANPFGAFLAVFENDGMTVLDPGSIPDFVTFARTFALIEINRNELGVPLQSSVILGEGVYDVVILNGGQTRSEARFTAASVIPEPGAAILLGLGLAAMAATRQRRA